MAIRHLKAFKIDRISGKNTELETSDLVVGEEPLEIRMSYGQGLNRKQKSISVTMRTPGQDFELALGFLFTEGLISAYQEIESIRYCTELKDPAEKDNVLLIYLKPDIEIDEKKLERHFYTTSSCGVCGKSSIESISTAGCQPFQEGSPKILAEIITSLPPRSQEDQTLFKYTGGCHAASLFDLEGNLLLTREDVGRHNAVDKVIGAQLRESRLPLSERVLLVSGRAGFELVNKAIMAGIPIMACVGAPSSLAVDLAREFNLTLIGFLRGDRFNIYSAPERILIKSAQNP